MKGKIILSILLLATVLSVPLSGNMIFASAGSQTITVTQVFPVQNTNITQTATAIAVECQSTRTTLMNVTAVSTEYVSLETIYVVQKTSTTTVPVMTYTTSTLTLPVCVVYEQHIVSTRTLKATMVMYQPATSQNQNTTGTHNSTHPPPLPSQPPTNLILSAAIVVGIILALAALAVQWRHKVAPSREASPLTVIPRNEKNPCFKATRP